jgi:glucose/arabinose dehydrogenase
MSSELRIQPTVRQTTKNIRVLITLLAIPFITGMLLGCSSNASEQQTLSPSSATQNQIISTTSIPTLNATITALVGETSVFPTLSKSPTIPPPTTQPPIPTDTPTQIPELLTPAPFPDPTEYEWHAFIIGLKKPVGLTNSNDGSGRLFILEQNGRVRLIKNGEIISEPFLDIRKRVGSNGSEQGLLGIAFHPQYANNGFFYINYTDLNGNTVIARYQVSENPDLADQTSERILLRAQQPYANHNGGNLIFGPDDLLYLGLGDGGSGGDPHGNAQSLDTLLGKILRIDVDHGDPYAIPADNPFITGEGLPEIWAYGLRNPWRFSFDRLTGDLFIGDVGQAKWEEIDFLPVNSPGGTNFGWNYREGFHPFQGTPPANLKLTDPVVEYDHSQGCAVTGGLIYRGSNLPAWQGIYLYGDYCSGNVWGLRQAPDGSWQNVLLFQTTANITSFGADQNGEIYLLDQKGTIYQLAKK